MRLNVDVANSLNWNRLGSWNLTSERTEAGRVIPIPPVSASGPSPLILAGGLSPGVPNRWQLAAWCQPAINVNPGSTAIPLGEAVLKRSAVLLNRWSLIQCQQFDGVTQYIYTFTPAPWLGAVYLEAWWYDGPINSDIQDSLIELLARTST